MVRLYFACDAHGSTLVWKKWLNAPSYYNADIILFCGDLTGKFITPIIEREDGTYIANVFGTVKKIRSNEELNKILGLIENVGYYPFVCSLKEYKEFQDDPKKLDDLFKRLLCERMSKWLSLVTEKIDLKNKYVICMPGNDDELFIDDVIKSFESDGIIYPLGKVLNLFYDFEIISLEYVNPTPWKTPRECEEQELKEKIEKLLEKCKDPGKTIFNFHCPPFNTRLDLARKLSKDLKPSAHGEREHVGSKAVREAIEKYQPTLGLHGHIHESFAFDHIGKTLVVNPGSEYTEGILRGFVIDVTTNGIDKFVKVEG